MSKVKLFQGDNIELLKKLPDNSIDSVVTDPPYGLSFMNKKWDYDVPSVEFWKEVYRVLKPGGHVLSFGGTRTYHRMVVNIEDAGFEIRDQIQWIYGSGFPKSLNVGKAVDKLEGLEIPNNKMRVVNSVGIDNYDGTGLGRRYDSVEYKSKNEWEGWGTALKPANEPICVARKPLSEKSVAENVLKWRTGGINIDGCRIDLNGDNTSRKISENKNDINVINSNRVGSFDNKWQEGRFPANIIFDETAGEMLDEQSGIKSSRFFYQAKVSKKERNMGLDGFEVEILTPTIKLLLKTDYNNKNFIWEKEDLITTPVDTDKLHQKDTEEYITMDDNKWSTELFGKAITDQFLMDAKFIIETETNLTTIYQTLNSLIQKNIKKNIQELLGEMVSDIRFVENVEKKNTKVIIIYQKKDGSNLNVNLAPLEEVWSINIKENKCSHPTLKPIALMTYLCRLVTPPNGIVLDAFMGSGSTGIAARLEGFRFCGMEMDPEYFKIAEARIENYEKYREFLK